MTTPLTDAQRRGLCEIRWAMGQVLDEGRCVTVREAAPRMQVIKPRFVCARCDKRVNYCFVIHLDWTPKSFKICFRCAEDLLRLAISQCSGVRLIHGLQLLPVGGPPSWGRRAR